MKNTPYTRGMQEITKDKPYVNSFANRKSRRKKTERNFNNKKGIQLIVSKIGELSFVKYKKVIQRLDDRTIVHYVLNN